MTGLSLTAVAQIVAGWVRSKVLLLGHAWLGIKFDDQKQQRALKPFVT